tara:strand:- start:66 stop:698 length:633 start_codon:yes stop_codon:yes gene_type:complete
MSYLLTRIALYGDIIPLKYKLDYKKFEEGLELFKDKWVQYNPRKKIARYGLSITSLDGGFSGRPDLDSLKEYNIEHNLNLDEPDFKTLTPIWPYVESVLSKFKNHLGRTHIIKMSAGGQFPSHRDHYERENKTCRLFIPIYNCNPPFNYFILDDKVLHFDHGRLYFLNTCKEHIVFTSGRGGDQQSMFIVANVNLTEESTDLILHNMRSS